MVETRILAGGEPAAILEASAAAVRSGELVAFPTETVYGLGANALDAEAVARVFAAKERPAFDPSSSISPNPGRSAATHSLPMPTTREWRSWPPHVGQGP